MVVPTGTLRIAATGRYPMIFALDEESFSWDGWKAGEFAVQRMLDELAVLFEGRGREEPDTGD